MLNFSPVFLLCSERSGSNLIIRLLDSHPDFCGPPPSHLIRTLALNLTRFGDVSDNEADWRKLLEIASSIMQNQLGIWRCTWNTESLNERAQERSVRGIVSVIYEAEIKAHGKRFCIIKENRTHLFLPYLLTAFPEARYVWLVRDPRDMALSWKLSANHPGDVRRGARIWLEDQERFRLIYGYLLDCGRIHRLRYEDLVASPETTLGELCDFLEAPYQPEMLEFHRKEDTIQNAARIANWENLARPLISGNTGKYRDNLSVEEIGYIESLCFNEMIAHDYSMMTATTTPDAATKALEEKLGKEDTTSKQRDLTAAERDIREKRQAVIDLINAMPIRFAK